MNKTSYSEGYPLRNLDKKVTDRWWSDWSHRKDGGPAKQPSAQSGKITQLRTQKALGVYTNR